jgi:hypothetical protein
MVEEKLEEKQINERINNGFLIIIVDNYKGKMAEMVI